MTNTMRRLAAWSLAATVAACSSGGGESNDSPPPPVPSITVSRAAESIPAGGGTVAFTATLSNISGTVVWSVETPDGGAIAQDGVYTPPQTLLAAKDVTVKAAIGTVFGTGTVRVTAAAGGTTLAITTARPLAPVTAGSGAMRAIRAETNAAAGDVSWMLSPALGTLSATAGTDVTYTAPAGFVSAPSEVVIKAEIASLSLSDTIPVTVNPTALAVTGPETVKVAGATVQYAVTTDVGGAMIAWTLAPADAALGTISAAGVYTPPSTLSGAARTFQVVATVGQATGSFAVTLQPATISIAPATATIASGATRQLTATVDPVGAASQLSWSVVSGGGTISASGNPATYTAPAVAADTAVTIRAAAAGASTTATLTVLAAVPTFDVTGAIVDQNAGFAPVAGARVFLGGPSGPLVTTGVDGRFTFGDVDRPYTLVIVDPFGSSVLVYDGLTLANPVFDVGGSAPAGTAELAGVVRDGGAPVQAFVASSLSNEGSVVSAGDGSYAFSYADDTFLEWWGTPTKTGVVRAVRPILDGSGKPASYRYGTGSYTVSDGASATATVDLTTTPASGHVTGTVSLPAGFGVVTDAGYEVCFDDFFDETLTTFASTTPFGAGAFDFVVPSIAGSRYGFLVLGASSAPGTSMYAAKVAPGSSGIAAVLPPPPTVLAPADGATVDHSTVFQWTPPAGGATTLNVSCWSAGGGVEYQIITDKAWARIPDLSAAPVSLTPPSACWWQLWWESPPLDWHAENGGEDASTIQEIMTSEAPGRAMWFAP